MNVRKYICYYRETEIFVPTFVERQNTGTECNGFTDCLTRVH